MLVDDAMARRIRAAIALGGYSGVPALAKELGAGWGQDTLYEVLAGKKEIPDYVVREIARVCDVPFEFITSGFSAVARDATATQDQLDAIQQMLGNILALIVVDGSGSFYADFVKDIRDTVIATVGEVQNELDSARLLHETPTQRLEDANASRPVRSTDRRRNP